MVATEEIHATVAVMGVSNSGRDGVDADALLRVLDRQSARDGVEPPS